MAVRFLALALLALGLAVAAGCASPDRESELPWNTPQPWETAPNIPGLEGR
jgi:hypothetical protein